MMEYLGERVSVERGGDRVSIVISARLPRWKEALLLAWVVAWLACGIFVVVEAARMEAGRERQFTLAFLLFWVYFLLRIGRVALWRLKGFELIRIKDGVLTLKDSILGFGRAREHFVDNIQRMDLLEIDERSFQWQMNSSFWMMGAERLGFKDAGRSFVFGKGLTRIEAERVLAVVRHALKRERKAVQ